jgi:hypothetical protein
MNIITIIGIILIVIGVVGLVYGGITYTSGKDVLDMGPMRIEVDQQKRIPLSPIVGAVAVALGVILILVGRKRSAGPNVI